MISVAIKYIGNKYWTFKKNNTDGIYKEIAQFLGITLGGLAIDLSVFYFSAKVVGPQFGISEFLRIRMCVILAAGVVAIWNFSGDKFVVLKR